MTNSRKILFIQTAFIGDAILFTCLLESWHQAYPEDSLHLLVRKGNESLFQDHPFLSQCWTWNKKKNKLLNLLKLAKDIHKEHFDVVINGHRHFSSGLFMLSAQAKHTVCFNTHPLSLLFKNKVPYSLDGKHETERYFALLQAFQPAVNIKPPAYLEASAYPIFTPFQNSTIFSQFQYSKPRLYPSQNDADIALTFIKSPEPYLIFAPGSVWKSKQMPVSKWIALAKLHANIPIYIIGAKHEDPLAQEIISESQHTQIYNLCGQLTLLQSTALMQNAQMNFVHDSAPMHLASAVNAPTTAIFCSTIPEFGFGPLSDQQRIWQISEKLPCRPCGVHGFNHCKEGHFDCGFKVDFVE